MMHAVKPRGAGSPHGSPAGLRDLSSVPGDTSRPHPGGINALFVLRNTYPTDGTAAIHSTKSSRGYRFDQN
jgi:hypothetical protein